MLAMYFFTKYLKTMDDYNFEKFWENKFLRKQRNYWIFTFIYFLIGTTLISQVLLFGNTNLLFGLLVVGLVLFIYGMLFIRSILRFLGFQNARYMQIKMGAPRDTFSKDNVVG